MESSNNLRLSGKNIFRRHLTCLLLIVLCCIVNPLAHSQETQEFVLLFRNSPNLEGSLIRFGDLLEVRGQAEEAKRIYDLPLVPTPQPGTELRIAKEEILQQLQIRGYDISRFRWLGESEKVLKSAVPNDASKLRNTANLLPAFATDRNFIQAERNLKDVVSRYLAVQNSNLNGATIQFDIPKEQINLFFQRRNIRRIGGGVSPWTGEQTLTVQVLDKNELIELPLKVYIQAPETYVVAVRPIRRGDIVEMDDLRLQAIPASNDPTQEAIYFTDFKDVIGKQLRRSISSGQAIREDDVGPPLVVEKNQLVQIKVVIGGVEVETAGRAITEGAVGDLVQVETLNLKERKKLTAQVLDTNSVQVIAAGVSATRR
jgi:flagella basal body P-ring formation protein FlgA